MVQLVERQRLIVAGVSARRRAGFSLVELVVVLVVIAVLAAIAYVAYAVLVRDAGTKALMATAYSVDREAVGLSTFDLSSPASQVGFVLDGSGNGFRWTEVSGVWDSNGVVVTPTAEGGYVLTKGGAEAVCYSPSLVPATAGVVRTLSEAGGVCAAAGAPVSPNPSTPPSGPEFSVLGILDDVFNSNVADVPLRQPVFVVVAQPDGMVVVGGNFLDAGHRLARFTTDGLLDKTFRDNVAVAALTSPVESVALQLDGKLVVGGWFTNEGYSYLARFNADGTLDDVFNTNVAAARLDSVVRNVLVQPDGKIVVGGEFNALGMNLVRFNTDGTLDETFVNSSEFTGRPNAMVLQPDGKIVAATGHSTYAMLKRFNTDGTLDAVFGSNAAATGVCLCSIIPMVNLAVQPDGKIVAGGSFNGGGGWGSGDLVRFNADGTLDSGFTGNVVNGAPSLRYVSAVVIQPDGKIVVSEVFGGLVMRFNADGTLDSSFNSPTGSVVVKFAPTGFAVLPGEGGLVVGGFELVEEPQGLPTLVKLK